MLDKILVEVCEMMSDTLDREQLAKLKNTLFIAFHGKEIVEEKCEIIPVESDEDMRLLQLFRASKIVAGRAEGTLIQYIRELQYCRNIIGKKFREITTMDLRWYLGMMQEQRKNKMTTIQNKIHYLNSFYSFLLNEGIITINPVSRIEKPKLEKTLEMPFSIEDMESIRKHCRNVRDRALVEFLHSTGLRVSEAVSLNVGDIDMHRKEFSVVGKGKKERLVYFSDTAYYHLKEYLNWRCEKEGKTLPELKSSPLFANTRKSYGRMSKSGIETLCRSIGLSAKVDNVHPHRFRRTFATNMAARGMKLEELAKLMGHSKLETTLIYCNVVQENVRNAYCKCA